MQNSFAFSNYVTGESFFNRYKELSELLNTTASLFNVMPAKAGIQNPACIWR